MTVHITDWTVPVVIVVAWIFGTALYGFAGELWRLHRIEREHYRELRHSLDLTRAAGIPATLPPGVEKRVTRWWNR